MKKQLLIISLLWWTLSCVTSGKRNLSATESAKAVIVVNDSVKSDTIDLGRVHAGEIVRKELLLQNGGDRPMIVLSAVASCGCTTVDFEREPVQPGAEAGFVFEFDSKGFSGYQLKHITLRTTLSKRPFTLVVTGEVE